MAPFFSHPAGVLLRLQALLVVSCAVENGDAHLKNFAVFYCDPESDIRLAPAYDIVATTLYQPRDTLALSLGGSKQFPDRKALVVFGRRTCDLRRASRHYSIKWLRGSCAR